MAPIGGHHRSSLSFFWREMRTYRTGIDPDGNCWITCVNPDCKAFGLKSYSKGDIDNLYCSCCGFHESKLDITNMVIKLDLDGESES